MSSHEMLKVAVYVYVCHCRLNLYAAVSLMLRCSPAACMLFTKAFSCSAFAYEVLPVCLSTSSCCWPSRTQANLVTISSEPVSVPRIDGGPLPTRTAISLATRSTTKPYVGNVIWAIQVYVRRRSTLANLALYCPAPHQIKIHR